MKKMMILFTMVVVVASLRAEGGDWDIPTEKEKFHVFILMGQSNMAGGIPGKELTKEDKTPVPHILLRRGKGWIPAAHPLHLGGKKNGFGLGLPFAKEYLKNHPGVTVGLVPCASGGKRIDLLKKGSNLYRAAMGKTRLALAQGTIKAILWHQGESDTVTDERADSYEEKLHQLIADVREDLKAPNLPFIVGDLGQLYGIGENNPNPDPGKVSRIKKIRDALRGVLKKVKNTGVVETKGLTYSDAPKCTHFDKESYIILGKRYCEAYENLMKERKQNKGDSLRPALEEAKATLDENRMQVHHVGRWANPKKWADHKYANSCVRWRNYTLLRIDPCKDNKCGTCFAIRNRIPRGEFHLSYTNNPEHHKITAPGKWELYDIDKDPFQGTNIAAKYPDIAKKWPPTTRLGGKKWNLSYPRVGAKTNFPRHKPDRPRRYHHQCHFGSWKPITINGRMI